MINALRKYIVGFTLVLIFTLLFIQVRWIIHSIQFQEKVFQKTVTLALNQTISNLTTDTKICSVMKECISKDSLALEKQLTSAGVWEQIHEAIDSELATYDINLEYDVYIVKKGEDSLKTREKEIRKGIYYSQCLKDIVQTSDYELVVRFPSRTDFFLEKTGLLFISSVILIMLIIISIVFILSLYQRELKLTENTKELINNISHEFKTPISSISLASNLIKKKRYDSDEKLQDYAGLIYKENKKLQRMVESLLHLAAIEHDEFEYNKENLDVNAIIEEAITTMEIFLWETGGAVNTQLSALNTNIFADKLHVLNAIINILSNAIKYSSNSPEIEIRTKNDGENIVIDIEDKGMGIPSKYLKFIFQKYYRVPTGDVHDIKGFGIGLSYVKKVMEAHNGEVHAESVYEKGSIFTLIFPLNNGR
ncbi:MAG: HAMP domain-containing histidine kinase [Mariniphaga sp.]|nr:HAMP domain-containing histidine kinase [Mariniphaga sp.]